MDKNEYANMHISYLIENSWVSVRKKVYTYTTVKRKKNTKYYQIQNFIYRVFDNKCNNK